MTEPGSQARHPQPASADAFAALSRAPLFAALDRADRERLAAAAETVTLAPGGMVFHSGQPYGACVHLLVEGRIEVQRPDGSSELLEPGAVLGLANYLDQSPYGSTAIARTPVRLLRIPDPALRALEHERPALADAISRALAERIRRRAVRPVPGGVLAEPVRHAMKAPLATCAPDTTLREACRTMQHRRIGSLAVRGPDGALVGVLTFAGLAEASLLHGARPEDPVARAACETPRTVSAEAPLWEAEARLERDGLRYLIVVDEDGQAAGVISRTDILERVLRAAGTVLLEVRGAPDLEALAAARSRLVGFAAELRETQRRASRAVRLLSEAHLAIQRRALALVEEALEREAGPAPCAYAVIVMGSGGRREMLLDPDQDNGLITAVADGADWFATLAARWCEALERIGYRRCPGGVMACEPAYRADLATWRRRIDTFVERPGELAGQWSNVVLDFDTLAGEEPLVEALRRHLLEAIAARPRLLEFMAEHDAQGRPALGLFERLRSAGDPEGRGRIDLKRNGLRLLADAARIYALGHGVGATATGDRLRALARLGVLSRDLVDSVLEAHDVLLDLLLTHQLGQALAGDVPDALITPRALSATERSLLRNAMRAVRRLQDRLLGDYGRQVL